MQIQTDSIPLRPFANQVEYWQKLGFGISIVQVSARVRWHLQYLQSRFRGTRIKDLSILLEAHLWYLLGTPTITDFLFRTFTPHYLARRGATPFPSDAFLQHLSFDDGLAWIFPFGSFGYNFTLMEKYAEYLHPSQMAWIAFARLLASVSGPASMNCGLLLKSDEWKDDAKFASFPDELVNELVDGPLLRFLGDWVPRLFVTNLDDSLPGQALERVRRALLECGVDETTFVNLPFKFVHLILGNSFFEASEALFNERKRWEYVPENDGTVLDSLAAEFFFNVSQVLPFDHLLLHRANIIMKLPAGGFNEVFVGTAAALLNRALILLAPLDQNTRIDVMTQQQFDRIRALMFLAGQTLRRSTLDHLQRFGFDLVRSVLLPGDYLGESRGLANV